jgi:two-component system response regulator FixJ
MPGQPVIHIVDDNDAVRDSLALLFECADMAARTYASGEDLLTRLQAATGDCLITDVQMPQMSGLELLRRLKAQGATIPVIVITARSDTATAEEALRDGAAAFVEKPFDADAILAAVAKALSRG